MNIKFDRLHEMPIWYALKSSQGLVLNSFTPKECLMAILANISRLILPLNKLLPSCINYN